MKRIPLIPFTVILIVCGVQAQTPSQNHSSSWMTYTVKSEAFSVDFPARPAMTVDKRGVPLEQAYRQQSRKQISIGSYADGVVYVVYVVENPIRQSLDSFIGEQARSNRKPYVRAEQRPSLDGSRGETWLSPERDGMSQFFAKDGRLYEFKAIGAPVDDPRMTKFFSSLSLTRKKDGIEVKDGPGLPPEPNGQAESAEDAYQKMVTGKEVEKKVRLGMKPEPSYTESARQHSITGIVVIKCIFRADGRVTDIKVIKSLPDGLTERAVEAAKKIKFIPATKDGMFVSMWMQLEYNFNLY